MVLGCAGVPRPLPGEGSWLLAGKHSKGVREKGKQIELSYTCHRRMWTMSACERVSPGHGWGRRWFLWVSDFIG